MRNRKPTRGFTLLEVLIALLIFSLGVLGMAALLVLSVQTNHSAYLRTQASFLAQSMADRMRANASWALYTNLYNGTWTAPQAGATTCQTAACGYAAVATRDIGVWTTQIARFLPNATESINCAGATAIPSSTYPNLPPYSGLCTITLAWSESTVVQGKTTTDTPKFVWIFQP